VIVADWEENDPHHWVAPPDGYDLIQLGGRLADRDQRLRAHAEAEVRRPGWAPYPEEVRRAYVRLYGRAAPPTGKLSWAESAAVRAAMSMVHEDAEAQPVDADPADVERALRAAEGRAA